MKISIFISAIIALTGVSTAAFAQDATPTTVPTTRLLTCSNSKGSLVVGICGVKGCTLKTKLSGVEKSYLTKRTKNSDGSLTYKTVTGAPTKCTAQISALKYGNRILTSLSCASTLKNSKCNIK